MGKPNKRKTELIKLETFKYKKFNTELDEERRINEEKRQENIKKQIEIIKKQQIIDKNYQLYCERERLLDEQQDEIKRFHESQLRNK